MRPFLILLLALPLAADRIAYTYDEARRLAKVTYENGRSVSYTYDKYTYDKAGNLLSRTVTGAGNLKIATALNLPSVNEAQLELIRLTRELYALYEYE